MKPVPEPCGTSSDVPAWLTRIAASLVTWTVAGRTLSTALDRLGRPERSLVFAVPAVGSTAVAPDVWVDDAVAVVVAALDALSGRSGESLSEPPQATRKSERMA